ncbi:hypothetical protein ACFL2P_00985 [Candidatus Moduliflexota bacterium]
MLKNISRISALAYAGLFTVLALLSGAEDSERGYFVSNMPNVLPWLLVWGAVLTAWKKPRAGGIVFLALAAASIIFFHTYQGVFPFLLISMPLILISILFLLDSRRELLR